MNENPYQSPETEEYYEKDILAKQSFHTVLRNEIDHLLEQCGATPYEGTKLQTYIVQESRNHPYLKNLSVLEKRALMEYLKKKISNTCQLQPKTYISRLGESLKGKLRNIIGGSHKEEEKISPHGMTFDSIFNEFVAEKKLGTKTRKVIPAPFLQYGTEVEIQSYSDYLDKIHNDDVLQTINPILYGSDHVLLSRKSGNGLTLNDISIEVINDKTIAILWKEKRHGTIVDTKFLTIVNT